MSLTRNLHLVFSQPPPHISAEEFNRWYDAHLAEILVVPGFVSARRFELEPMVVKGTEPLPLGFLSLYEIEGEFDTVMAALDEEASAGRMKLPEWFEEIKFASWNATSLGDVAHEAT
jgi:hypothetical protein